MSAKALPAEAVAGAVTTKCVPDAALTAMFGDVPVMDAVAVSVAVIVCAPSTLKVAEKVPTPPVSVASAGRVALPSVLVKWTVPEYVAVVLLN